MDTERQQSEIEWPEEQRSHVLRNTSLGMTALTVGLILIGTMVAASAPPDAAPNRRRVRYRWCGER